MSVFGELEHTAGAFMQIGEKVVGQGMDVANAATSGLGAAINAMPRAVGVTAQAALMPLTIAVGLVRAAEKAYTNRQISKFNQQQLSMKKKK